jgi:regulator of sirC expression with transglutaminase-like and TPR domain
MGLVFFKAGEKASAREAFERYLREHPKADDKEMIQSYLRQLE